jgi:hypothetical protein
MVIVEVDGNLIYAEPMKNKSEGSMIKACLALWNHHTASGTVKPKTHIMDNKASEEYKKEIKKLHNPISPTRQPQTKSCRTSDTNLQKSLQGNPCGSRQHFSNATLGKTLTINNPYTQISTFIKCSSYCLSTPICTWQLV